jgi:hypothetical protein
LSQVAELDNSAGSGGSDKQSGRSFMSVLTARENDLVLANIEFDNSNRSFSLTPDKKSACTFHGGDLSKPVKIGAATCNYKYEVIAQACMSAYSRSYENSFKNGYRDIYGGAYTGACEGSYDGAFAQYKDAKYQEGYAQTYQPPYDDFFAKGAAVLENQAYSAAKTEAYNANIVSKRQHYFAEGQKDAVKFFAENAVVQLVDVAFDKTTEGSADSVVAGDQLQLKIRLANFGGVASARGQLKTQIVPITNNGTTSATQGWVDLVSLPGQTVSTVRNIALLTIKGGIGAEDVALKVLVKLADGQVVEAPIQFRTVEHVTVQLKSLDGGWLSQDGYKKPRVGRDTKVNAYFRNESVINPNEDLKVELSAVGLSADDVEVTTGTATIGKRRFSPGDETGAITLYYKVKNQALVGKKITMALKVKYKGNISLNTTFEAIPEAR